MGSVAGAGVGGGFGGALPWTPDILLVGAVGLFADLDAPGAVTRNTQPTPNDWDMEAAGVGAYTPIDTILSKEPGAPDGVGSQVLKSASTANFGCAVTIAGDFGGRRILIGATGKTTAGRTLIAYDAATGSPYFLVPGSGGWDHLFGEQTPAGGRLVLGTGNPFADTYWDNITASNLSVSQVTCKGNLGNLVQATAANMPWDSDASAPTSVLVNGRHVLYFDGVADYVASPEAASTFPFHKAAGFTCVFAYKPTTGAAGTDTIVDTCNATNTNVGITIEYDAGNAQIVVKVANGSGTFVVDKGTGAASVPANAWSRVTVTWTEAAGVSIRVDEDAADTDASVGAASAADATATLQVGRTSGGANFIHGALHGFLIRVGAISDAQCLQWLAYEKAWLGL